MNPWIVPLKKSVSPKHTLICFHYAGGSASSFRTWSQHLPKEVDLLAIEMPGRWERHHEVFIEDLSVAVEEIYRALQNILSLSYSLVGYSMGALIAFELAQKIKTEGLRQPEHLLVISRRAPSVGHEFPEGLSSYPKHEFLEYIQTNYGIIPMQVLESQELIDIFLPVLRADIRLIEKYSFKQGKPLDIPITAWAGKQDKMIDTKNLKMWAELTTGRLQFHFFDGGHFFINQCHADFFREMEILLKK